MAKELLDMKMYHVDEEYAEKNQFNFIFIKAGELIVNGMLTEVFIVPMPSGSMIRLVDSIIMSNRERQVVSVNYIKTNDVHLVQSNSDKRFRIVVDTENSVLSELLKSTTNNVTYQIVKIEEAPSEPVSTEESEEADNNDEEETIDEGDFQINSEPEISDIVKLSNGTTGSGNENKVGNPGLERPNRVHLDNQPPRHQNQQRVNQNQPQDGRNDLRQRFSNPMNRGQDNRYQQGRPGDNRPAVTRDNFGKQQQQTDKPKKDNKKRDFSNIRPILAPTNLEMVN